MKADKHCASCNFPIDDAVETCAYCGHPQGTRPLDVECPDIPHEPNPPPRPPHENELPRYVGCI